MKRIMPAMFVCSLILLGWSGCGSNGGTEGSPSTTTRNIGAGFNQARGFNESVTQILPIQDGSGDVYVSGDFTTYGNQVVRPIVRLRPNGSLNPNFVLTDSIKGSISSMALADDGSGDLYVGDYVVAQPGFSNPSLGHIRRVNSDGTIDPTFALASITVELDAVPSNPSFKPVVRSLAPVGDKSGRIYVAVEGRYNGALAGPVVRLNSDGSLDTAFDSRASPVQVFRIVPANDGSGGIYIATFRRAGPSIWLSHLLLRLRGDGTLDPAFDTGVGDSLDSRIDLVVPVEDGSGDLLAVCFFPNFTEPFPIVRIKPSGALDFDSPRPLVDPASRIVALAKTADGSGDWLVAQVMSLHEVQVIRYRADGTRHPTFAAVQLDDRPNNVISTRDGSGDIYVGGKFLSVNGQGVNQLVRVNHDGTLDAGTVTGSGFHDNDFPIHVAPLRDGSGALYATGLFTSYNGAATNHVTRLNATGQYDVAFKAGLGFGGLGFRVRPATTLDDTGRLYVGGDFSAYDGEPVSPLMRLLPNGTRDATFTPEFNAGSVIEAVAVAEDGTGDVYAGGLFSSYQGVAVSGVIRIHADGLLDRGFASTLPPGVVIQIVSTVDGSGDIYVQFQPQAQAPQLLRVHRDGTLDGSFAVPEPYRSQILAMSLLRGSGKLMVSALTVDQNGDNQSRLVRLNSNGMIDTGFNMVTFDGVVRAMAPSEEEEALYTGGAFTAVNGTASTGNILRIGLNGILDPSFAVGTGFNNEVWSIAVAQDGSGDIFVGGTFTRFQSTTMQGIARLNRNGTAD